MTQDWNDRHITDRDQMLFKRVNDMRVNAMNARKQSNKHNSDSMVLWTTRMSNKEKAVHILQMKAVLQTFQIQSVIDGFTRLC